MSIRCPMPKNRTNFVFFFVNLSVTTDVVSPLRNGRSSFVVPLGSDTEENVDVLS